MELEIIQVVSSMGVGALLGTLMFIVCRSDKKATEDRLTKLLQDDQDSRREHTQALTELTIWLKAKNGD